MKFKPLYHFLLLLLFLLHIFSSYVFVVYPRNFQITHTYTLNLKSLRLRQKNSKRIKISSGDKRLNL